MSLNGEIGTDPINVPPRLPVILKQFCKAAIRTQPYDLLKWSSAYFRALAEGAEPPAKIRLEYPLPVSASGLTFGFVKVLLRQFGDYNRILSVETVLRRWDDLCLDRQHLNLIMIIGKFRRKCQVKKFLAIAVGLLGSCLFDTMLMICELFTMEPDGGSAVIPVTLFMEIYEYLAGLRCDGERREVIDDDPTDFLILDSLTPRTPELSEEKSNKNCDIALNSDDTDEINTDLQSALKEEQIQRELSNGESEENVDIKEEIQEKELIEAEGIIEELVSSGRDENSSRATKTPVECDDNSTSSGRKSRSGGRRELNRVKKKFQIDPNWLSHYPNVPGIGPRLKSDSIAAVADWLAECSTIQNGMVGPRNLRHFQCPPLDRLQTPSS